MFSPQPDTTAEFQECCPPSQKPVFPTSPWGSWAQHRTQQKLKLQNLLELCGDGGSGYNAVNVQNAPELFTSQWLMLPWEFHFKRKYTFLTTSFKAFRFKGELGLELRKTLTLRCCFRGENGLTPCRDYGRIHITSSHLFDFQRQW